MATIILNTETSLRDHSVRMNFGDVYALPSALLNADNVYRLMSSFSKQEVLMFVNQVSFFFFHFDYLFHFFL